MNIFGFKVATYLDDEKTEKYGFVVAETFSDAVNNVSNWYGEMSLFDVQVSWMNDTGLLEVSKDLYEKIVEEIAE